MEEQSIDYGGVYVAFWTGGAALLCGYFGTRGLWQYSHGSTATSADPILSSLALLAVPWLVRITRRLVQRHPVEDSLLSGPELLLFSVGALAGAVWGWTDDIAPVRLILAEFALGIAGLVLWWRRARRA